MCKGGAISSGLEAVGNISNALMADATAKGNAKTIQSVSKVQSKKIKEQGQRDASSAMAAAAENGLDVNVGVPALIEDEILGDAAYNASMNISQAGYSASDVLRQGKMQRNNYGYKAASDVIKTAAQAYDGWK
ncbi:MULTISPECIES: hypothetical protein [Acinetobacter]|nr:MULTISPECIES: hypothetical protein [Acinetobacter]AIL79040.1 hypothetical protein IX87_10490 [Acinetobacter baumannii]ATD20150.1 hypothetical protein BS098_09730 [Acinetobacter baumannii]AVO89839.1 hypothetical protein AM480_02520 [Acinetobacter baumannii]AXG83913.1 hypothetical protein Aba810CP_03800 [Acinetobacter baumannii]EHZ6829825.1 hypothetical protein [Acinetobacter baumannii]